MNKQPLNIILLGRAGSGKGTQGKFLAKELGLKYISSGSLFRTLAKENTPLGKKIKEILIKGGLQPDWLAFWLWVNELKRIDPSWGIILDGASRRLEEAKLLDKVFAWLGRTNLRVFLIHISPKEVIRRLLKRGRKDDSLRRDDTRQGILRRLDWFEEEVMPVVRYYKKTGRLIKINGQQSKEEVFKEIKSFL